MNSNDNVIEGPFAKLEEENAARASKEEELTDELIQRFLKVGETFCGALDKLGDSDEFWVAKQRMAEAVFWAVKGITG